MDPTILSKIAIKAALSAGKIIKQSMDKSIGVEKKIAGASYASQVITDVDRACETVILSHLIPTCDEFDLALLSEESDDDGSRFHKDYFWCVDPMDGTLAFINKYPGFSVSIALVAKDGTPHIGVVYDPSSDNLYHAIKDSGAYKNGTPWVITNTNNFLTYVTDRKLHNTSRAGEVKNLLNKKAEKLNLKEVKETSGAGAVLNAIIVLENGPACMMKLPKKERGGGCIWDFAATACIYHELGLSATNFEGGRLDLNRKDDAYMNHEGISFENTT